MNLNKMQEYRKGQRETQSPSGITHLGQKGLEGHPRPSKKTEETSSTPLLSDMMSAILRSAKFLAGMVLRDTPDVARGL